MDIKNVNNHMPKRKIIVIIIVVLILLVVGYFFLKPYFIKRTADNKPVLSEIINDGQTNETSSSVVNYSSDFEVKNSSDCNRLISLMCGDWPKVGRSQARSDRDACACEVYEKVCKVVEDKDPVKFKCD